MQAQQHETYRLDYNSALLVKMDIKKATLSLLVKAQSGNEAEIFAHHTYIQSNSTFLGGLAYSLVYINMIVDVVLLSLAWTAEICCWFFHIAHFPVGNWMKWAFSDFRVWNKNFDLFFSSALAESTWDTAAGVQSSLSRILSGRSLVEPLQR